MYTLNMSELVVEAEKAEKGEPKINHWLCLLNITVEILESVSSTLQNISNLFLPPWKPLKIWNRFMSWVGSRSVRQVVSPSSMLPEWHSLALFILKLPNIGGLLVFSLMASVLHTLPCFGSSAFRACTWSLALLGRPHAWRRSG